MHFAPEITIDQYRNLSKEKRYAIITIAGIDLLSRFTSNESRILFSLYQFYVEVVFCRKTNEIIAISCYDSVDLLGSYLEQIPIDDVTILLAK